MRTSKARVVKWVCFLKGMRGWDEEEEEREEYGVVANFAAIFAKE